MPMRATLCLTKYDSVFVISTTTTKQNSALWTMEDVNAFDIYKMHKKAISSKPTYVFRGYLEILHQLPVQNAGKLYHNKSLSHHWNLRIAASILISAMVKKP